MINYLFSSIDRKNGFTKMQSKSLKESIKKNQNITFIANLFNEYKRNDEQVSQYKKIFSDIGITFNNIYLIDNRLNKEEMVEILKNTDIVFLMGGSPELQIKSINEYNLKKEINNVKIIIGVSAGSMNQSKRVMYIDDFDNYKMKDYEGLNLVDINIFPHFELNNNKVLDEVKKISNELHLILLPKESFVVIKNNEIDIIGEYYKIFEGEIS